jgi:hypothetical protein
MNLSEANKNSACAKCVEYDNYYYDAEQSQCLARSTYAIRYHGCIEKNPFEDYCLVCKEDYESFVMKNNSVCLPDSMFQNRNDQIKVEACTVYSIGSPMTCMACKQGYVLINDTDTSSCLLIEENSKQNSNLIIKQIINQNLTPSGPQKKPRPRHPANCNLLTFSEDSAIKCGSCNSDNSNSLTHIISEISDFNYSFYMVSNLNPVSQNIEPFPIYPVVTSCVKSNDLFVSYKIENNIVNTHDGCMYGQELEDGRGVRCLRCFPGKAGKVYRSRNDKNGIDFGFQVVYTVADCGTCPGGFFNQYIGLGSHVALNESNSVTV